MKFSMLIITPCFTLLIFPLIGLSQHKIAGQVLFPSKPAGQTEIFVNVLVNGTKRGHPIKVDKSLIFSDEVPKKDKDSIIQLTLDIIRPQNFICRHCPCEFYGNNSTIYVCRKQDLYVSNKDIAYKFMKSGNPDSAVGLLEKTLAGEYYENYSQQFELQMELSRAYLRKGDLLNQQVILKNILSNNIDSFSTGLGKNKQMVYWQERYDNILNIARYDTLKDGPLLKLANLMATDSMGLSREWQQYVSDYIDFKDSKNIRVDSVLAIKPNQSKEYGSQLKVVAKQLERL